MVQNPLYGKGETKPNINKLVTKILNLQNQLKTSRYDESLQRAALEAKIEGEKALTELSAKATLKAKKYREKAKTARSNSEKQRLANQARIAEAESARNAAAARSQSLQTQLNALRSETHILPAERNQLTRNLRTALAAKEPLKKEIESLTRQLNALRSETHILPAERNQLTRNLQQALASKEPLKQEIETLTRQLKSVMNNKQALEEKLKTAPPNSNNLKRRLETVKQLQEERLKNIKKILKLTLKTSINTRITESRRAGPAGPVGGVNVKTGNVKTGGIVFKPKITLGGAVGKNQTELLKSQANLFKKLLEQSAVPRKNTYNSITNIVSKIKQLENKGIKAGDPELNALRAMLKKYTGTPKNKFQTNLNNALRPTNRYSRLQRLQLILQNPDYKNKVPLIKREIQVVVRKLYGSNVGTTQAWQNLQNAKRLFKGGNKNIVQEINSGLKRVQENYKRRRTTDRSSYGGGGSYGGAPSGGISVTGAPVSIKVEPPSGGPINVVPRAQAVTTSAEQLVRNAGGVENVEKGITALRATGGNVNKARAKTKLPLATFTNIYAMGGPVAAKKTVERIRRRRRTIRKKRVTSKPKRKQYIKLTPYQFKRLVAHIKKNNLRQVLVKEITH